MSTKKNIKFTAFYILGCAVFLAVFAHFVPPELFSTPLYISVGTCSTLLGALMLFKLLQRRDAKEHAKKC
jgi:hypothetical protein